MAKLIRKIINKTKDLLASTTINILSLYLTVMNLCRTFLVKSNFNLVNVMRSSLDLELEELRLERSQLEARAKTLMQKQRSAESMLTDLTRNIKQMEFDIVEAQKQNTDMTKAVEVKEKRQASNSQQK